MATSKAADQKKLGQWLRTQRLRANLTQKQLADHLDVSYQMIQKMERGLVGVSVQRLQKISKFLGVPAGELMADFSSLLSGGEPVSLNMDARLSQQERRLLLAFNRVDSEAMKRKIVELVEQIIKR